MHYLFQYVWTPIAVVMVGYILLRWMGKRAVSEMTGFDLIVNMILATAIAEPIVTKKLGIASYYSIAVAIVYQIYAYATLSNPLKRWLIPKATVLIQHGDISEKGLRKAKMPIETLLAELRTQGYTKTADVEMAVLEEVGKLSVIPKADYRPLQPSDLQITPSPTFIPIPVIIDGKIIYENLTYLQKGMEWLRLQLQATGRTLDTIDDVSLATYTQQGALEIDKVQKEQEESVKDYKPLSNR